MKKFGVKNVISRAMILVVCVLSFLCAVVSPVVMKNSPIHSCSIAVTGNQFPTFKDIFKSLFNKNVSQKTESHERLMVYLGGEPIGFTINCKGVVVVSNSNPSVPNIKPGDVITKIENIEIGSAEDIYAIANSATYAGLQLNITYTRAGEEFQTKLTPIFDDRTSTFRLGLWIRDDAAGVGTLTYVRQDNLRFGALGHPVCDVDTGMLLPVASGNIFKCNIVGCRRGEKGSAGELKGLFLRNGNIYGSLDGNNKFGVYGQFSSSHTNRLSGGLIEVARRDEVKSGKAKIRCTIDGITPKEYDIEIVKTYFQETQDNKSMFIRVTDKELLAKTGGIVQGMSGSPIIQNGKLVGAITHVFVSDPTKGYGVYADWMIKN